MSSKSKPSLESRPIYIIGHRCNDPKDIGIAINSGCNAVECDLKYDSASKEVFVNHDLAWGTKLSEWLKSAKEIMKKDWFSLIIFDCKFAADHDDFTTAEALSKVRQATRDYLNAKEQNPINVLFSIAKYDDRKAFNKIMGDLQPNEGIAIDQSDEPDKVENFFRDNLVENGWYGDGSFILSPKDVFPYIQKGSQLRDKNGIIKKVYVWTLGKKDSIKKHIEEGYVDGVMINVPKTSISMPFLNGLTEALDVVEKSRVVHLATRNDPAFTAYEPSLISKP